MKATKPSLDFLHEILVRIQRKDASRPPVVERIVSVCLALVALIAALKGVLFTTLTLPSSLWWIEVLNVPAWFGIVIILPAAWGYSRIKIRSASYVGMGFYIVSLVLWAVIPLPPSVACCYWLHTIPGAIGIALIVAGDTRVGILCLVLITLFAEDLYARLIGSPTVWTVLGRTLVAVAFCSAYAFFIREMLKASKSIERFLFLDQEQRRKQIREHARQTEARRLSAISHDHILSVLRMAGQGATYADLHDAVALTRLGWENKNNRTQEITGEQFRDAIKSDPFLRGVDLCTSIEPGTIPRNAADSMIAAIAEAVRNARRHAGVEPRIQLRAQQTGFTVQIIDNGSGFDLDALSGTGLGIPQSIFGRMAELPGGTAAIDSNPGKGTTVRLEWKPIPCAEKTDGKQLYIPDLDKLLDSRRVLNPAARNALFPITLMLLGLMWCAIPEYSQPVPAIIAMGAIVATVIMACLVKLDVEFAGYLFWSVSVVAAVVVCMCMPPNPTTSLGLSVVGITMFISMYFVAIGKRWLGWAMASAVIVGMQVAGLTMNWGAAIRAEIMQQLFQPLLGEVFYRLRGTQKQAIQNFYTRHIDRVGGEDRENGRRDEFEEMNLRVYNVAAPFLARLEYAGCLTESEKAEVMIAWHSIRDWIRGRRLIDDQLSKSLDAARRRGASVTVLDDFGEDQPLFDMAPIRALLLEQVTFLENNESMTVRMLPAGRKKALSVITYSGDECIRSVDWPDTEGNYIVAAASERG